MLYFDYSATAPADEEIYQQALAIALAYDGNPSSIHQKGLEAKTRLAELRQEAATLLAVPPASLIFNSGATEGNQAILLSLLKMPTKGEILVNKSEHEAVYANIEWVKQLGYGVKELNNNEFGQIDLDSLRKKLSRQTKMVLVMLLNNETGAINPISELVDLVRAYEKAEHIAPIHIHVDATQALGKLNFSLSALKIDSAVFSAHKVGGPKGVGLFYLKKSRALLLKGGGQENNLRSGTESLFGAAAMTLTLRKYLKVTTNSELHQQLFQGLKALGATILPQKRTLTSPEFSPYIINCAFLPLPGEVLVRSLSKEGIYISTGSACSSNKKTNFRVLEAAGVDKKFFNSSVRFSYGTTTTVAEIELLLAKLKEVLAMLQQF